ncbi:MAG: hypothetical protein ACI85U_004261 [Candidatus Promineifilaceae bacterium]
MLLNSDIKLFGISRASSYRLDPIVQVFIKKR